MINLRAALGALAAAGLDATAKARHALSLLERLRSALASLSASATAVLQPTANSLAGAPSDAARV